MLAYAQMSIGRAEIMVGTIKKAVGRMVNETGKEWEEVLEKVVFGYHRCPLRGGSSPFQLLYGVKPRLLSSDYSCGEKPNSIQEREMELLAVLEPRAARTEHQRKYLTVRRGETGFQIGQLVLVAYRKILKGVKCPPFSPKLYGPCRVIEAKHLRYKLLSSTGMQTRKPIHARRFVPYHSRF